ncbi:MAG: MOSC domain-containing protein [Chloroflexi bacterium]|nr:MOSC domain-containing protein [Chloroflexota bacterium]
MKIESINIGEKRTQQRKDYAETTGIYKLPAAGPVEIRLTGIDGDAICDMEHHGGPDQAIYVYGGADYDWWSKELGRDLSPGTFGENLTISELSSAEFNVGDSLHIGDVILQVTAPRIPCGTFATRMGDSQWVKKFRRAERPGLYCRVLKEGMVNAGDVVEIKKYTGATISILQMYRDYYEKSKTEEMLRLHLNAPIAVRSRVDLEKELETLLQEKR